MSYTSATESHPRAALRNKNLPKLPEFEFPARQPSPQPLQSPHTPYDSPQQHKFPPSPPRSQSHPSSLEPQIEAQLNREISETLSRQSPQAKVGNQYPHTNQAKGTGSAQGVQEGFKSKCEGVKGGNKEESSKMAISDMSKKGQWIFYAITSGGCAAVNGVFAKLTTTEVTTNFATFLANIIGLEKGEKVFEFVIRAIFFALNLLFNGIMWALFTKALSRSPSTTQVSILNTSSNFMLTALLGFIIFSESLPPMWWLGASLLVAGNVIIGRREEKDVTVESHGDGAEGVRRSGSAEAGESGYRDSREEDRALLADDIELSETESEELKRKRIAREVEEDILDLEPPNGATSSRL